jgi:hypothetical protein
MSTRYGIARVPRMMLGGLLVAAAAVAMAGAPAAAHGRGRVFFGLGFGAPAYYPYPYYYPPYYYYPPPAYAPVPPYGTVQPTPSPAAPTAQDGSGKSCREYQTTVQVDGQWQPAYGTACLQPDGTWRTVN